MAARSRDKVAGGGFRRSAAARIMIEYALAGIALSNQMGGDWQTRDWHYLCHLGTIRTGAGRRPDGRKAAIINLSTARA
jgi:hypothetical protein